MSPYNTELGGWVHGYILPDFENLALIPSTMQ